MGPAVVAQRNAEGFGFKVWGLAFRVGSRVQGLAGNTREIITAQGSVFEHGL